MSFLKRFATPLALITFTCSVFAATNASAKGRETDCGDIAISLLGKCKVEWSGECETVCESAHFEAVCQGQCSATVAGSCTAECEGSCNAQCQADPITFDCEGSCNADCSAKAAAWCKSDTQCYGEFVAFCSTECEAQCDLAASVDCEAQCEASCEGSCRVDANFECLGECRADLQAKCQTDCETEGALICGGEYVPVEDLEACLDYLEENGMGGLEGAGEGSFQIRCAIIQPGVAGTGAGLALLAFGLVALRRRRRNH